MYITHNTVTYQYLLAKACTLLLLQTDWLDSVLLTRLSTGE